MATPTSNKPSDVRVPIFDYPVGVEARIIRALDRVRPSLAPLDADVRLLGVENGVARLALSGDGQWHPTAKKAMKLAVARAVEEQAPELTRIEVEGPAPLLQAPDHSALWPGMRPSSSRALT